jgi:Uma2 family endonuclease
MADGFQTLVADHRPLSLEEFFGMLDAGIIAEGERTELIEGALSSMASEGELHDEVLDRFTDLLAEVLGPAFRVRQRSPLNIPPATQLAPDVSVWDAAEPPPEKTAANARLICEISRTTKASDLGGKADRYAAAGVGEYWVLEPDTRRLTVFRGPGPDGWAHRNLAEADGVRPLCAPQALVKWTRAFPD